MAALLLALALVSAALATVAAAAAAPASLLTGAVGGAPGPLLISMPGNPVASATDSSAHLTWVAQAGSDSVSVLDDTTGYVVAQVSVGVDPDGIALVPTEGEVYVSDEGSDAVSVISTSTDKETGQVTVGPSPAGIAFDPVTGDVYVADSGGTGLKVIDPATGKVAATIPVGGDPTAVAVDTSTGDVYVAVTGTGSVAVVSPITGAVSATIPVGAGPAALAVNEATGNVYVADTTAGTLSAISSSSDTVTGSVTLGGSPDGVAIDPVTGDVLVVDPDGSADGTLSVVDPAGTGVVATVPTGNVPAGISLDSGLDTAYVPGGTTGTLSDIDLGPTEAVATAISGTPTAVAADPVTGDVLVTQASSGSAQLFPGANGAAATGAGSSPVTVPVGSDPDAVAVDPATGTFYVANHGSSSVSVVSESSEQVVATVPTQGRPDAVAVDPGSDTVYALATGGELTVIDGTDDSAVTSVNVGTSPVAIAVDTDNDDIFVANGTGVRVLTPTLKELGEVDVSPLPSSVTFDPPSGQVEAASTGYDGITTIDPSTLATAQIPLSGAQSPSAVVPADVTGLTYLASSATGEVWAFSDSTGALLATFTAPAASGLAVDGSTGSVFVALPGSSAGSGDGDGDLVALGGPVPSQAPTGVGATSENEGVTASWTAPAASSLGGSSLDGYAAAVYTQGSAVATSEQTLGASATSATFTGLANGTPVIVEVEALTGAGPGVAAASSAVIPAGPPSAPTGVTAVAGNEQAAVSWDAPTDDNGLPVSSYLVTPFVDGTAVTDLEVTVSGTPPATQATVMGLTNGTQYGFEVAATNGAGTGLESAPSPTVTPATVPGPPTGVTAVAGDASAQVSWGAPGDDGGLPVSTYLVTPFVGDDAVTSLAVTVAGNPPATQTTVMGLTNGTAYTFAVTASNPVGPGTASSQSAAVTPGAAPSAPTGVTAVAGDMSASVSWTAPSNDNGFPVTSYVVTPLIGTEPQSGLEVTVTGTVLNPPPTDASVPDLVNGVTYSFEVVAGNALGSGAESAPSNAVTPATIPAAPSGVTAVAGVASAKVSWQAPDDGGATITSYDVTPVVGGQLQPALAVTVGQQDGTTPTTATVENLLDGTAYGFVVTAANTVGPGPTSAESNTVLPGAPPSAPLDVDASAGSEVAEVRWSAPASTGGLPVRSYTVTPVVDGSPDTSLAVTVPARLSPLAIFHGLTNGTTYSFTVVATTAGFQSPAAWSNPVVPVGGYWLVSPSGTVTGIGVRSLGSLGRLPTGDHVVSIAALPASPGYVVATSDGSVTCFGDAVCHGGIAHPASPVVALLLSPQANGYLLVEADGAVQAFGGARPHGSLRSGRSSTPIVGASLTPDGNGYLMVNAAGQIFAFGNARDRGSLTRADGPSPATAVVMAAGGAGYYILQQSGAVRPFGGARYFGSFTSLGYRLSPAGLAVYPGGGGYIEVATDGVTFALGPGSVAYASPVGRPPAASAGVALAA